MCLNKTVDRCVLLRPPFSDLFAAVLKIGKRGECDRLATQG